MVGGLVGCLNGGLVGRNFNSGLVGCLKSMLVKWI